MEVTVDVKGGQTEVIKTDKTTTYADLLAAVDLSPQEAAVLVDGRPVPEDNPVSAEKVTVLRLVAGGNC